jgi:hypothetical protein
VDPGVGEERDKERSLKTANKGCIYHVYFYGRNKFQNYIFMNESRKICFIFI